MEAPYTSEPSGAVVTVLHPAPPISSIPASATGGRRYSRLSAPSITDSDRQSTRFLLSAIQTILQMIAAQGDEIILPTPAWPNYAGPMRLAGARPVEVALDFANGRWHLDLDKLFAAIAPKSKAIVLNSPSNPVGWTASLEELKAVRDECRKRGLWIVGDEVYARFYYGAKGETRAPSFLDICDTEERLLLANTFSKNWAMTGWRVGWLQAPKAVGPAIERIIQYNTSGTAAFLQQGCAVALSSPGKWTYVYGRLDPAEHIPDILQGAARYGASDDGIVPWRERPEIFRKNSLARIPPLEEQ